MDIQMDDIPYSLHQMVEIIGMKNFLKLCMEVILFIFPFIIRLLWGIGIEILSRSIMGRI